MGSFVVMVLGFAFLGNLLYGPYLASFHGIVASFSYLLLVLLGVFDYDAMQTVRVAGLSQCGLSLYLCFRTSPCLSL